MHILPSSVVYCFIMKSKMNYLVILTDGAADWPVPALGGKTPLEVAYMPFAKRLAERSVIGSVLTVPDGMSPGSDVANLCVMGYDPKRYHTGRSPLEAASIGVEMRDDDVSYRANIVTLAAPDGSYDADCAYEDMTMIDHASGDISTEDCAVLVDVLNDAFAADGIRFYVGTSYRHCLVVRNGSLRTELTPPHDFLGFPVKDKLPAGENAAFFLEMQRKSYELLKDHPINKARIAAGKHPANSLWLWGAGRKPSLSPFGEKYGVDGAVISAVDLIKGIGILAGLESIDVDGATGTVDSNFDGKAAAATDAFRRGKNFVYIHLEATDEAGHQGSPETKVRALELFDEKITGPLMRFLGETGDPYKILLLPDHPTPIKIRTHVAEPVPYVLFDSRVAIDAPSHDYTEAAGKTGPYYENAVRLTDEFFRR